MRSHKRAIAPHQAVGGDRTARRRPAKRTFIFGKQLHPLPVGANPQELDERVNQQMLQIVRQRFEHLNGKETTGDRVALPDANGDLWLFRVVTHRTYPALGEGPFVFFCMQPGITDWSAIRPSDFQADNELARLIPAIRFMESEFHRGPTLPEIAKQVHLSPFHFHRRFTELLGITPNISCSIARSTRRRSNCWRAKKNWPTSQRHAALRTRVISPADSNRQRA